MSAAAGREADTEIVQAIAAGDLGRAATGALRAHGPKILGFLWLRLRDEEAVQECYAQFCEDLWNGLTKFRGECAFRTYAFQLAYNAACRYRRDPFRRRGRPLPTQDLARVAAEVRSATAWYRKTAARDGLARVRAQLDPDEQALLALRLDQEMSWEDVARVLSDGERTLDAAVVRKRFHRLKRKLRELGAAEGLLPGT